MVIYWTNRSAKLINLVMDKAHFLSQNSPSRRSELLGRKTAAFSGAFVSLPLLQFTKGWLQSWTFPCPRSLPTPRFAGGMWESLKPQNQEFGDRLFVSCVTMNLCFCHFFNVFTEDARSFLNETASYLWFCGPGFFLFIILLKPQPLHFLWRTQRQTLSLNLWNIKYQLMSTWTIKTFTRDVPYNVAGYVFLLFI